MHIIIIIVCVLAILLLLFLFIKYHLFTKFILKQFQISNVIVAGKKGCGKDLLFQYVINKRKDYYYSNISYGGKHKIVKLKDVSCAPNDYNKIVNDNIVKSKHLFKESKDFYISDIGVFLPSYMDSKLYVQFPSMPILYALSRHLYDSNIHCNTQNVERGWKALREQADFYIICRRTIKIFCFLITFMTAYDKYASAKDNLQPIKTRMLNKYSKAQADLYKAKNGLIRNGCIISFIPHLKYNTRAFEKILLKGRRKY
ncbi:MAG: hypothetical protein K6E87_04585 [bacterium]|nr:hypothetical protein [bacterium]